MMIDDNLRDMILKEQSAMSIRDEAIRNGMKTLRQSGLNAVAAGYTSLEEIISATL